MSNPPAATLGADELLAPLGGRWSGRRNNRRARQDRARRNGHTRSGGRSRGLHWRPQKSVDYLGLIRLRAFRSSAPPGCHEHAQGDEQGEKTTAANVSSSMGRAKLSSGQDREDRGELKYGVSDSRP